MPQRRGMKRMASPESTRRAPYSEKKAGTKNPAAATEPTTPQPSAPRKARTRTLSSGEHPRLAGGPVRPPVRPGERPEHVELGEGDDDPGGGDHRVVASLGVGDMEGGELRGVGTDVDTEGELRRRPRRGGDRAEAVPGEGSGPDALVLREAAGAIAHVEVELEGDDGDGHLADVGDVEDHLGVRGRAVGTGGEHEDRSDVDVALDGALGLRDPDVVDGGLDEDAPADRGEEEEGEAQDLGGGVHVAPPRRACGRTGTPSAGWRARGERSSGSCR